MYICMCTYMSLAIIISAYAIIMSAYFLSLNYFYRANFKSVLSTSVREWRCSRTINLTERQADRSVPVFVLKSQPYNWNNGFPQAKYHPLIIANMEIWGSKCGTYHHHLEVIFYFSLSFLSSLFSSFPHQKWSRFNDPHPWRFCSAASIYQNQRPAEPKCV